MDKDEKMLYALSLLRDKAEQLGRLPKRSDFSGSEVCFIKQKLGPFPRALEKAGLKEAQKISSVEKNRIKRMRRKKELKKLSVKKDAFSEIKQEEEK